MVTRHFSSIPNNNLPGDDFSAYTHHNAFQSKFYEKVHFVKPIGNISKIDITWCLEPMIEVIYYLIYNYRHVEMNCNDIFFTFTLFPNRISNPNQITTSVTFSDMKGKEVC